MARRQQDRSAATRQALVATARRLFAERGYADVPADEIVAAAGLTRGALRHHFGDKAGLFRAVFEQVEQEMMARIVAALTRPPDTGWTSWAALTDGLAAFLDACEEPEVIQIALTDAATVLGWSTWRAISADYGLGLVAAALRQAMDTGVLVRQPVDVLARLLLSAAIEAALLIAQADDPPAARATAEKALHSLLAGLRRGAPAAAEPLPRPVNSASEQFGRE